MQMKNPPHPGGVVLRQCIEPLGLTITDAAAYGLILTQGHGTFGGQQVSTPAMIRYGQMTEDELFVTADAAANGVRIENRSESDPLVILKHFGPGNPEAPRR